jgi:hypothetical protein
MRSLLATGLMVVAVSGCAPGPYWAGPPGPPGPPVTVFHNNPTLLPITNHECAWETVVDVVDDYFKIQREEPVRLVGNTLTEGRLDTFPQIGATFFEPWLHDSAGPYERVESTLQSMRRRAVVRVMPAEGGYLVDVAVVKELEDVLRPEHATAGAATFRYDDSLTRVVNPVGGREVNEGWIGQGRDTALEQRILDHLHQRSSELGMQMLPPRPW